RFSAALRLHFVCCQTDPIIRFACKSPVPLTTTGLKNLACHARRGRMPQSGGANMSYYIANDGLQRGPLEKHQLLAAGLRADTLVWSEGMADWQPAHQVQELREVLGGARAATPPPPPP